MDRFILAMIGMTTALLIIIGGGFIAVGYFKSYPEAFQVKPLSRQSFNGMGFKGKEPQLEAV